MGIDSHFIQIWRRLAGRGRYPSDVSGRRCSTIPQHFARLSGDARTHEMLCLADWLIKSLSDGSRLIIQRPDGTLQEVNYKQKK